MQESHGDLSSVTAADLETACVRWAGRPANLFAEKFAEIAAAHVARPPSVRSSDFHAAEALGAARLVPVVSVADAADAVPLGRALLAGGATVIEVVLRTPAALDALGAISRDLGDQIGVGAGTVLTILQAERAVECGAKFIVSPGLNPELVRWCNARGVPIVPGVATPTEIEARGRRDAAEMPPRGPANMRWDRPRPSWLGGGAEPRPNGRQVLPSRGDRRRQVTQGAASCVRVFS